MKMKEKEKTAISTIRQMSSILSTLSSQTYPLPHNRFNIFNFNEEFLCPSDYDSYLNKTESQSLSKIIEEMGRRSRTAGYEDD